MKSHKYKMGDTLKVQGFSSKPDSKIEGSIVVVAMMPGSRRDHGFTDLYGVLDKTGFMMWLHEDWMVPHPPKLLTASLNRGDMDRKVTWKEFEEATKIPRMTVQIGPRSRY